MEKPVVTAGDAPNGPEQINEVADFVEQGWRFRSGTAAARAALPSDEKFDGLVWADRDSGRGIYEWSGSAWLPISRAMARRVWTFDRTSSNTSDAFSAGSFVALLSGGITAAPAGEYLISASLVVNASAVAAGQMRIMAGSTNVSLDMESGVSTVPSPIVLAPRRLVWAGGDMAVSSAYQLSGGSGTVYKVGSFITVEFVAP